MERKTKFPKGFLWGVATSAYQVEGNNFNNDWSRWEKENPTIEKAGIACNQYETYDHDFKLAKKFLHNNIHQLSIEWSRIFPQENSIDNKQIEHYREVLKTLRKDGLQVMLALHHYTNPTWFTDIGGWQKRDNIKHFIKYAETVIEELGDLVDYWMIFIEPDFYAYQGFLVGRRPPEVKNPITAIKVYFNLAKAHKSVYKLIHRHFSDAKVTSSFNFIAIKTPLFWLEPIRLIASWISNFSFIHITKGYYDHIGVNYYGPYWLGKPREEQALSDFGWPIYPKGIYEICKEIYSRYKVPIIITENGIADANDSLRPKYIVDHITWVLRAIKEGIDIRGYFHWTLMDNYEWEFGRKMKFGLFKTDFKTLERIPRKSAYVYSKICKANGF